MKQTQIVVALLSLAVAAPALAKTYKYSYPNACSEMWPAVKATLADAEHYAQVKPDDEKMTAEYQPKHDVISAGWWPGNGGYGAAAFYCYAAPVPDGLAGKPVQPGAWDAALGEFILKYDEVRTSASPEDAVMGFLETTYAAGADAAAWDRGALERPVASAPCG